MQYLSGPPPACMCLLSVEEKETELQEKPDQKTVGENPYNNTNIDCL